MGLMTETPWEAAVYAASMAPSNSASNVDYHRENLRQLKKMQSDLRLKKEAEANRPLKAFPLTEANKKKFDHVQSKVQEWVVQTGRESSNKAFLRSHSKTGPFLEDSGLDSDSVIRVKRLSGLKSKDKQGLPLQASDYGTMSQSCHSIVPPLNLEEVEDYDEVAKEVSLGYVGLGMHRFSEITIDERKDRIQNLINEIYASVPLNTGNSSRKSLNQSIRRYASVDQVSDVDSVITSQRPQRSSNPSKLSRHPSFNNAANRAAMLRKYASSPKLSVKEDSKISVKNFSGNGPSAASSMLNLKAKKNSLEEHLRRHPPLKEHKSAPQADQISVRDSASQLSRRTSKLSLRKASEEFSDNEENDDETLTFKGSDIDYVRANIHCATAFGKARKKECDAAAEALKEKLKKKSESMKPGEKYKQGSVPKYLKSRQASWKAEAERIEREKPDPDCPPGHRKLSDGDRREKLGQMRERVKHLVDKNNSFPITKDNLRLRQMRADIEKEMTQLEESIRIYERTKVFVPINPTDNF